jgi:hypothetical protein
MVVACLRLRDEAHDLLHGHHQNAEHQMAEHLGRPAHAVAAAIILEVAVDALGRTALVVTDILGEFIAGKPFGTGFGLGLRLAAAARIGLDDWNMPERAAAEISGAS